MKVAVCDDSRQDCELLSRHVSAYFEAKGGECDVSCFYDSEKLTKESLMDCDILFMDIYFPGSNGMDIIKKLKDSISCQVVFVTTSADYAVEAFSLDARHYILKPFSAEDVNEALKRCLSFKTESEVEEIIEVKTSGGILPVVTDKITFIEVFNTLCTIHTFNDSIQIYSSLGSIYERLNPKRFIRANRSFVVNMDYIISFGTSSITLKDGQEIVLSRQKRRKLREQYQDYLFERARNGSL